MVLTDSEKLSASRVYFSMPYNRLDDDYIDLAVKYGFNYEIGLNSFSLENFSEAHFIMNSKKLRDSGIRTNIHAPFNEIFPGTPDSKIRKASLERLNQAFDLVPLFSPETVVVHLYYEERRFGWIRDVWLDSCIDSLVKISDRAKETGTLIALENVYEENPDIFASVFDRMRGFPVGMCADVGHMNAFSWADTKTWLEFCKPYIAHFHLHDNNGTSDQHRAIGTGNIDFDFIRDFIAGMDHKPVVTLEAHSRDDIFLTLKAFSEKGFPSAFGLLSQT